MARKVFLQDLDRAKQSPPAHITNVQRYDGDGVSFNYWYLRYGVRREVVLKLITTNIDDYPDGNQFMLFTEDADVDPVITNAFVQVEAVIGGSTIPTALREISGGLHQVLTSGQAENPITLDTSSQAPGSSDGGGFDSDDQGDGDDDDASFGLEDLLPNTQTRQRTRMLDGNKSDTDLEAVKIDLRAAKEAGFKIGVHGSLSKACIVCVSIRLAKVGISQEALQAWGLQRNQYMVLLIKFQQGYRFISQVMEEKTLSGAIEMRVGLCDTYKPAASEAFSAFNQVDITTSSQTTSQPLHQYGPQLTGILKPLFIGRPMHDLLRDRFPKIVKFRSQFNLSWSGAERLFNDRQGTLHSDLSKDLACYKTSKGKNPARALADIVVQDMLSECEISEASLPLVAMQFVLRHLVRCTEFCLVCHCRVEDTFEALKPYVCSSPLCLYQFLALGFGPAAEWEIISQPYVVDLLVSLCYSQAQSSRIREFPLGINLRVPLLPEYKSASRSAPPIGRYQPTVPQSPIQPSPEPVKAFAAKFQPGQNVLSPEVGSWAAGKQCVTKGDWIVVVPQSTQVPGAYHCRISSEQGLSFVLDPVIHCVADTPVKVTPDKGPSYSLMSVDCYLYNANFDELPDQFRHHAILCLLDTLPSVKKMREELVHQQEGHREANLNVLRRRCPQAALDLLRWIIASNRSCIMQVDEVAGESNAVQKLRPSEDRVSGMDDWMQFRFAQGAPDKEQRFVDCVKKNSGTKQHPTLFAWHGSPLYNWHSIIRQGLNFDEILHGRASGHGVYMSPFVNTSMGYTNGGGQCWPRSALKMKNVVSLQEVVNAPESFVSRNPHFVVAEKDWIQTRYLFVKTDLQHSNGSAAKDVYPQDPQYTAKGICNESVAIPITAISKSRRPDGVSATTPKTKKRKVVMPENNRSDDLDDGISVATEEEDWQLLSGSVDEYDDDDDVVMTDLDEIFDDIDNRPLDMSSSINSRKRSIESRENYVLDNTKTNFVPGSLDTTNIRFLDPPSNASVSATRALMRAFNDTIKVQENIPLHDLGFYMDPNRMENMYQWIIELHSFEETLPLTQDMKEAGVTSIVCEMLFTNDFPFSPPFVRVVKPRFLDPMMGGGGHITNGGAICMELLTSTGWSAVNSIESVLLQVRLAMSERERPARLLKGRGGFQTLPYDVGEAIAAYKRFCLKHGWQAPKSLDTLQSL